MTDRNIKTHPLIDRNKMSLVELQVSLDALTKIESSLSKTKRLQDILKQVRKSQAKLTKAAKPTQKLQNILKQIRETQAKLAKTMKHTDIQTLIKWVQKSQSKLDAISSQDRLENIAKSAASITKLLERYGKQ